MCVLFLDGSLVDSIYRGLVSVTIQSVFVFCLRHSNPFTFKVIIDRYGPVAIYFVVLGSHLYNLSVFPV